MSKNNNKDDIVQYLDNANLDIKLAEEKKELCEGSVLLEECQKAIYQMGNDKSPG